MCPHLDWWRHYNDDDGWRTEDETGAVTVVAVKTSGERCGEVVIVNDFGFGTPITKQRYSYYNNNWTQCLGITFSTAGPSYPKGAYPGLCAMELLSSLVLGCWSIAWLHSALNTTVVLYPCHLYTSVDRGTVRAKWIAQENNTMCSRSQLEPGLAPGVNHLLPHTFQVNEIQTKEKKKTSRTQILLF